MQTHRILSGFTILLMVVLVAAGWFLVAQPQLAQASTANETLDGVRSRIQSTQSAIAQLRIEQKKVPELTTELNQLRKSIPAEASSSTYIDGLNALATATGVTITTIKVEDAVQYAPPPSAPSTSGSGGATASPTPTPTPTPGASAVPKAPTGWVAPTSARITSQNFVAIPVSIVLTGTWDADLAFMKGLQTGDRLFLVNEVTTNEGDDPSAVTATIGGYIYVLLDPKSAALDKKNAASTASPSPTPTPTPTVSSSPNPSGSSTPTPTTSPTP